MIKNSHKYPLTPIISFMFIIIFDIYVLEFREMRSYSPPLFLDDRYFITTHNLLILLIKFGSCKT
jgi:hypothetical protein